MLSRFLYKLIDPSIEGIFKKLKDSLSFVASTSVTVFIFRDVHEEHYEEFVKQIFRNISRAEPIQNNFIVYSSFSNIKLILKEVSSTYIFKILWEEGAFVSNSPTV